jgi:hypothetical protein
MKNRSDNSGRENADEVPGYAALTGTFAEVDRMQNRSQAASERGAAA